MIKVEEIPKEPTSMGMDQAVAAMLAYMFGWISGLIFFFVEKQNRYVKFAAMQSIILSAVWFTAMITLTVFSIIPYIGLLFALLNMLLSIGMIVLVVFLIVFGYQNKKMVLPVIGPIAERIVARQA